MAGIHQTTIKVLAGVPLDNTYSDTIKFTSAGEQEGFFSGKAKYAFPDCSYQRVSNSIAYPRGAFSTRVPVDADDLYTCNYLMFQNVPGGKWFYAFIRQVNYITVGNTEIIYELDYIQTYLFDFEILPCLVLREHPKTDNLFEHLQPEPFGSSDMIINEVRQIELSSGQYIEIGVTTDPQGKTVAGQSYAGIYSGVEIHEFSNAAAATAFLRDYDSKAKSEAVAAIWMSPWSIQGSKTATETVNVPSTLAGYTPRNKKLLSYPYIKIEVSNRQGEMKDYYYEYFAGFSGSAPPQVLNCVFSYSIIGGVNPAAYLFATNYKGGNYVDYDEVMEISGFPTCAWSTDAFANWWGGEGIASAFKRVFNLSVDTIGSQVKNSRSAVINFLTGKDLTGNVTKMADNQQDFVTGMLKQAADLGAEAWVRNRCPGLLKGSGHGTSLNFSNLKVGFDIKLMSITPETAAVIDDFFDAYGYSCNRIKVPEMEGRNAWNFVQTQNCIIKGSMPVQAMAVIKNVFNTGIRLWHNGDWVGDYSQPNYPV